MFARALIALWRPVPCRTHPSAEAKEKAEERRQERAAKEMDKDGTGLAGTGTGQRPPTPELDRSGANDPERLRGFHYGR